MRGFRLKRMHWMLLGAALFIALNGALVYYDDEQKVDRLAYVNGWTESFTTDMKEELTKTVVLAPIEVMPIYFDEEEGSVQEFLVEEGQEVRVGEELFTYQVHHYYETVAEIQSEMDKLNGEIAAIEQAITQMEGYTIQESQIPPPEFEDAGLYVELPNSSREAELMKEQFLVEKEQELSEKNAQLDALNSQLQSLQQTGDTVTYTSPYAGRVKGISDNLEAPVLSIESLDLQAIGKVTEEERKELEEGMEAELFVDEMEEPLTGRLVKLADSPTEVRVHGESTYPFAVLLDIERDKEGVNGESDTEINGGADPGFNDEVDIEINGETDPGFNDEVDIEINGESVPGINEELDNDLWEEEAALLPGYHGQVTITTEERFEVTAVDKTALMNDTVWTMTPTGLLLKNNVETGLAQDGMYEITTGIQAGELLAEAPTRNFRDGAYFITPLQWKMISQDSFSTKEIDWKKSFVSGLLSR